MNKETVTDLSDDIEVVGPGKLLAVAREKAGLSQADVANRLNFQLKLVQDIENEIFDKSLPATYNRGYLKNFAKLVNIPAEDVLTSYEMLGVAEVQGAEMQSFSKITEKQAHNTLLMTVSYLILAGLIGATVMLWQQSDVKQPTVAITSEQAENQPLANNVKTNKAIGQGVNANANEGVEASTAGEAAARVEQKIDNADTVSDTQTSEAETVITAEISINNAPAEVTQEQKITADEQPLLTKATFTFSGDCWVNIVDASGERIAWGIKKAGYKMPLSGVAPFTVTLGQPELVSIVFDDEEIDMTQFNHGNIAKFSLPVEPTTTP